MATLQPRISETLKFWGTSDISYNTPLAIKYERHDIALWHAQTERGTQRGCVTRTIRL